MNSAFSTLQGSVVQYDSSLLAELERTVGLYPNKVAIQDDEQEITFSDFSAITDGLAAELLEGEADFVFVVCERSIWFPIFFWACLKSGKIYSPVDTSLPDERVRIMIKGVGKSIVYSSRNIVDFDRMTISLDARKIESFRACGERRRSMKVTDNSFLLYTSGTTGVPKGIIGTESGLLNRMLWMRDEFAINDSDVIMYKTPVSFDVHLWEIIVPLISGAKMYILGAHDHKLVNRVIKKILMERITMVHFVPSVLRLFCKFFKDTHLFSLKSVFTSGESLKVSDVESFQALFPETELVNLYGPAEASVDVTYFRVPKATQLPTVPIGRPIANVSIHIMDKDLNLLPVGNEGEIFIGGIALAEGYTSEELTKQNFLMTHSNPSLRLYRTGDIGKITEDSVIHYLGREDSQVKINGVRIELAEVEFQLGKCLGVQDSAVLYDKENLQLVAFVVGDVDHSLVKENLSNVLPAAYIPAKILRLQGIPLSANGKRDLKQLLKISNESVV